MRVPRIRQGILLPELVAILLLAVLAFSTRLMPLHISPYPFNNDSLTDTVLADGIMSNGHLAHIVDIGTSSTHSTAIPALDVLLAFVASSLGTTPVICSQALIAVVSLVTIVGVYIVGRRLTGDPTGGLVSGIAAALFGTFVFSTGSVWKESLGIGLLVLAVFSFVSRNDRRYWMLCFVLLMLMPLVHHLVFAIVLLIFSFPVIWSWIFALSHGSLRKRHYRDAVLVAIPLVWSILYYSYVSLDRLAILGSAIRVGLIVSAFVLLCLVQAALLLQRRHYPYTLAPIPGIGLVLLVLLDYSGYIFPYASSAIPFYLLLAVAFGFVLSLAWYGLEIAIEEGSAYRAVQLAMLLSPLAVVGFGLTSGLTRESHQIFYRSFDFVDFFLFFGAGTAIVALRRKKRRRSYFTLGTLFVASLLISFPFAYESEPLLGVRHDTQEYEVDALSWIVDTSGNSSSLRIQSDERISHIAMSLFGIDKENNLPSELRLNLSLPPNIMFVLEHSWTTTGVNDYPRGEVVLAPEYVRLLLSVEDVMYVGGDHSDQLVIFTATSIGQTANDWYPSPS